MVTYVDLVTLLKPSVPQDLLTLIKGCGVVLQRKDSDDPKLSPLLAV